MSFAIVPAAAADIDTIVHHRRSMFRDMGYAAGDELESMCAAFRPWLAARMKSGEYLAWLARAEDGRNVAGLGLWLMDWPPHMIGPGAPRGNILNVYTEPEFRRRGIARALLSTALDWCRAHRIAAVILHASAEGRPLYVSLGFQPTNEMRISL
jgi:GNAT superfamily N-acetyltransferase